MSTTDTNALEEYYTYQDLMRLFRRSYMTVYVWKTQRCLPHIQIGPKRVLFPKQRVLDWAASQKIELHFDESSSTGTTGSSPTRTRISLKRSESSPVSG